jgi:hypothetical protein
MSAESRSHRVEGEVPSELEQVPVALDGDRMKASPEEMAIELVSMVEPPCVHAVQTLDARGEIGLGRLHDEVIVVRHQAVAEALPVATPYDAIQQSQDPTVVIVPEDHLSAVPAGDEVVDPALVDETRSTWHGKT